MALTSTASSERTAFTERYVDAAGFHVRYLEAGSGAPLVFVHGGGGLHLSKAHELLAEGHRVIAIEVPGFGDSPANDRSQNFTDLGAVIIAVAEALGLERINLWGTSFGAGVALFAALGKPEVIDALVLESPAAIMPDGGLQPGRSPEELRKLLFAHPERQAPQPPPDPDVAAKQRALMGRMWRMPRAELEAQLATLHVPTLVVFGTRDRLTPPELGRIYREKMPNCQFVLLYDAAHEASSDRPEAFSSLVSDFLARREAFIVNQTSSLLHP